MITRTLMRAYLPLIGLMASWVVMLGFILVVWFVFNTGPGFEGGLKSQTTLGSQIWGFPLGMGAVMLVGCEIRSHMRIAMGYPTPGSASWASPSGSCRSRCSKTATRRSCRTR